MEDGTIKKTIVAVNRSLMLALPLSVAVRMSKIFSDNVVLQRDIAVPVWGRAGKGEKVAVSFAGQQKTATADDDGKWMVILDPLKASKEPAEMKIAGANIITIKNILVGEVWLCSGQSNMQLPLDHAANAEKEIAAATNPMIHHIRLPHTESATPLSDITGDSWTVCSPQVAVGYTAVGYFFARELARELDVPVGLINNSWSGTCIESWICPDGYRLVPELKSFIPRFEAWDSTTEIGRSKYTEYVAKIKDWVRQAEAALTAKRKVSDVPPSPLPPPNPQLPTKIFNGMVNPLIPFAMRGVIWYQGEDNILDGITYLHKLKALVRGWRRMWNQGDFPFHIAQLPNLKASDNNNAANDGWIMLREAQLQAVSAIPGVGLAVTIDIGEAGDIHPKNKQDVGVRLAQWALAKNYNKNFVPSGPLYKEFKIEGDNIRISFDNVGSGLMVGDKKGLEPVREVKDGGLKWFAIAGEDKAWQWADAVIDGSTVVVSSAKVAAPVAVRYAFTMNPVGAKLYNREGLPASPFRTDK